MAKVPEGLYSSKVARFIADRVNFKKIKKLGGGPINVQTNSRSLGQIVFHMDKVDAAGNVVMREHDWPEDKFVVGIHFTKGKWKLTRAQCDDDSLTFPVAVGKTMTDDQAIALVENIFALA